MKLMQNKLNLSELDDSTIITVLVTPPAAMAAKRAGETLPQLKLIKAIPDVVFVSSATVLALISVKLSRKMFLGHVASRDGNSRAPAPREVNGARDGAGAGDGAGQEVISPTIEEPVTPLHPPLEI